MEKAGQPIKKNSEEIDETEKAEERKEKKCRKQQLITLHLYHQDAAERAKRRHGQRH